MVPGEGIVAEGKATAEASIRVIRMIYLAVGIAAVIFGALSYDMMRVQVYPPLPWLSAAFWVLLVGLLASLGVLAYGAPLRVLRGIALTAGVVQVGEIVVWLIIGGGGVPAEASVPWAITFTGVAAVAVAAVASNRVAWTYTIVVSVLGGLLRAATTSYQHPVLVGLQDGLYSFLLIGVFVGLMLATKQSAIRLDDTVRAARREMAESAGRLARKRERLLINALVHDSVLSTFLMAGLGRTSADAVARHAQKTTALLDSLAARKSSAPVTISELESRLRQSAAKLQQDIDIDFDADIGFCIAVRETGAVLPIPSDAAAAIVDAVAEALRNSALHAGTTQGGVVSRTVRLECNEAGLGVVVADDGAGFNTSEVPAERLGIAQSIIGRMHRVAGGAAVVSSVPGRGTTVTLAWAPVAEPLVPGEPAAEYSFAGIQLLSRRAIHGALLLFIAVHALLAFGDRDPRGSFLLEVVAVLTVSGAAVLVTWPAAYPLPRRTTVLVLMLCAVTAILQLFQITPNGVLPFVQWHLGAITLILLVLVAQGRVGWAWTGYAVLLMITVGWAIANGLTPGDGLGLIIRHAGTLLAGSLFVLGLRRSTATLEMFNRERTQRAVEDATTAASLKERASELGRVNSTARGLLDHLAGLRAAGVPSGGHDRTPHAELTPVGAALRTECLLVEASLRDAIRGRSLSVEPVTTAAYLARTRGVDVTLIDDGDDGSEHRDVGRVAVGSAVARELDLMQRGRLTARILPSGRPEFATIVVESEEQRMLTVGIDGSVQEL